MAFRQSRFGRPFRRQRPSVDAHRKWKGNPRSRRLIKLVWTGSIVYVIIFALSIVGYFSPTVRRWFDAGGGAGATFRSIIMWPASLAFTAGVFLLWRYYWSICRPYRKEAKDRPRRLVATAGSISDDVVGRDELCDSLIESLDADGASRAHVIVGRMGAGKTAMFVLLTRRLAEMDVIPVPVHLREATDKLDFNELAFERFVAEVSKRMASRSEAERVWRWLLRQRRVVVLADGLEEALLSEERAAERDNTIRQAIRNANDQNLPLVIASRPHDPLRSMDATISELEPLSEEASLQYVSGGGGWSANRRTVDWIVQTADFSEAPLYLQIARQLHGVELLEHPAGQEVGEFFEDTTLDRAGLRLHLLDTWAEYLIKGNLYSEVALDAREREAALDYLSALALVGLRNDSAEVAFSDLLGCPGDGSDGDEEFEWAVRQLIAQERTGRQAEPPAERQTGDDTGSSPYPGIVHELRTRIDKVRTYTYCDAYVAATWGKKLGIVEAYGDRVRFQHSLMQAYLGSRFMQSVLHRGLMPQPSAQAPYPQLAISARRRIGRDSAAFFGLEYLAGRESSALTAGDTSYFPAALEAPGRELLSALVLHSRASGGRCIHTAAPRTTSWCPAEASRTLLCEAADQAMAEQPSSTSDGSISLKDAEARILKVPQSQARALELYTAAIEVNAGEEKSVLDDIAVKVRARWGTLRDRDPESLKEAKMALVKTLGAAVRDRVKKEDKRSRGSGDGTKKASNRATESLGRVYQHLFHIAVAESSYRIRLTVALEIGAGGDTAFNALRKHLAEPQPLQPTWGRGTDGGVRQPVDVETAWRRKTLCAWLLPLLAGSAAPSGQENDTPMGCLKRWLAGIGDHRPKDIAKLTLSTEVALAQGFKFAANRRHQHPCVRGLQTDLADNALEMLRRSRFWYTRLTLLHARTLWALPDDITQPLPSEGPGADPRTEIREWLLLPDGSQEKHPFLLAAAELAAKALRERKPEQYLWTDESIVVGQIGSQKAAQDEPRKHNLWIPYSIGWRALAPPAQQLVADVLLLLNLAEQGGSPDDRLQHLHRINRTQEPFLPPCLTRDRAPLNPSRTGAGETFASKANCGCTFDLCPYPPRSQQQGTRMEFSEVFCRRQMSLIDMRLVGHGGLAPWQRDVDREALRSFWEEMGERAHDKGAGSRPAAPHLAPGKNR
ncbi:ATP-binding protein [Streptomyces sp. NBC_00481]|uniref:ATP-binding protein n=1 Tax=Streptomyces sp. NBC_00481 TaxID=2975755 RepID=UPI002DDB1736|nr:ATP-binding protein [Streptomyces sp. NBC_00481]WRZ01212.1 ATP-binding protein [Streptomyces sp. NBC_00481]